MEEQGPMKMYNDFGKGARFGYLGIRDDRSDNHVEENLDEDDQSEDGSEEYAKNCQAV